jgi:RimJ/RimL family protein N-acetyltransferase
MYAGVVPSNGGSIRVLENCGFKPTGQEDDGHLILRLDKMTKVVVTWAAR